MTQGNDPIEDQIDSWMEPGQNNVRLVYILYLASLVFGVTSIVGLIFAYLNRGKSVEWLGSHYTYLIRTFWIGLLYIVISSALTVIAIGFVMMFAVAIWFITRCVVGLQKVARNEPIENPESWLL